jgi:hypothetical protein
LDWHLVEWTRAQNRSNGVAPTASMLLKKRESLLRDTLHWEETYSRGLDTDDRNRQYLSRWRRFWKGRFTTIRTREDIPSAEVREKARRATAAKNLAHFLVPKSGPPAVHFSGPRC